MIFGSNLKSDDFGRMTGWSGNREVKICQCKQKQVVQTMELKLINGSGCRKPLSIYLFNDKVKLNILTWS